MLYEVITANWLILFNAYFPLNSSLESANAASDEIIMVKITTAAVVTTLLNIYLEIGIPDSDENVDNLIKLSSVGLLTNKRGGYKNNSL